MTLARRIASPLSAMALGLLAAACASPIVEPARLVVDGEHLPPRVVVPGPLRDPPLVSRDKARVLGMQGWLPARAGDPIAVVMTPRAGQTPTAAEVRDAVIAPLLQAIGFVPGVAALRMPPPGGVALPAPRFAPLAQTVAFEYSAKPTLRRPRTQDMLDVFLGRRAPGEVDRALQMGEGMTFAQFKAGIERREIIFPFIQVHRHPTYGTVPIEHALLLATAWEGESVRSVQGALVGNYAVTNGASLGPAATVARALRSLGSLRRIRVASGTKAVTGPTLVLLPFGTDAGGQPILRYAYRMEVDAAWRGGPVRFLLWADADTGGLLAVEPQFKAAGASGKTFNRDPEVPGTLTVPFEVDDAIDGAYRLERAGVAEQLNYRGGPIVPGEEVVVPASGSIANFDRDGIGDRDRAVCAIGGTAENPHFQQVSVFATLMRHRETVRGGGIFEPYPPSPWAPTVEYSDWGCNADMRMQFGLCPGYTDPDCPRAPDKLLNFAHDNTMVAHELGHTATLRLGRGRPLDWCNPGGSDACTLPRGWGLFEDLADFWAAHLESASCIGGWVGKNMGGTDASLSCMPGHSERNWFPRKLEVTAGATTGDHFPEHRHPSVGGTNLYADGQIAAAALWEVRAGMRSKCRPSGVPQFGVRFQRALMHTGFFTVLEPRANDIGIYQRLVELLFKMTEQWAMSGLPGGPPAFAHNGAHTTNKVTAGFARAGIFLVPWQCLDADPANDAALECPAANPGADAVIDVDDADTGDDDTFHGATVVDRDFLKAVETPVPKFHVWTGPLYRLDGPDGANTRPVPAPCNDEFQVEVTTDPTFTTVTASSPWIRVNRRDDGAAPTCYGTWSPDADRWAALRAGPLPAPIYYRARTRDVSGGTVRLSTEPGHGLWTVPPPYAVVTSDGRSDY